jgi:hypothetical protein
MERRRSPRRPSEPVVITLYSTWNGILRLHKGPEGSFPRELPEDEWREIVCRLWVVGNVIQEQLPLQR